MSNLSEDFFCLLCGTVLDNLTFGSSAKMHIWALTFLNYCALFRVHWVIIGNQIKSDMNFKDFIRNDKTRGFEKSFSSYVVLG